jgi:hypothetical protein
VRALGQWHWRLAGGATLAALASLAAREPILFAAVETVEAVARLVERALVITP